MSKYLFYPLRITLFLIGCSSCHLLAQVNQSATPQSDTPITAKLNFDTDPLEFYINYFKLYKHSKNRIEAFKSTCSLFDLKVNPEKDLIISAESKDGGIALGHNTFNGKNRWELGIVKRYPYGGMDKDVDFLTSLILQHVKDGDLSQPKMEYNEDSFTIHFLIGDTEGYMDKKSSGIAIFALVK